MEKTMAEQIIAENRAAIRARWIRQFILMLRVFLSLFIGLEWDLSYSNGVAFEEDVEAFIAAHFGYFASETLVEIIASATPWFCWCCLMYPGYLLLERVK